MTNSNVPDIGRSVTSTVTYPTRPSVNPYAAIGALALWLREEGVLPNGSVYTDESRRRRVGLMRELLIEFGIDPATAVERAAAHAASREATLAGGVR